MNIYGITPNNPTNELDINNSKILFSSLIAVGFNI
jgi:hypothetical protein